jgi:hypothetical protein
MVLILMTGRRAVGVDDNTCPHKRNGSIRRGSRLSEHVGAGRGYARIDTIAVSFTASTIHSPFILTLVLTLVIKFVARVIGLWFG